MTDSDSTATEVEERASATDQPAGTGAEEGPEGDTATGTTDTESAAGDPVVADSVRRSFGDLTVLSGVSFAAAPGTVNCFVGPNGSGKTTLLRIVAGLLAPTGGRIEMSAAPWRAVGYLPQSPSFRPQFTLRETLEFYGALAGVDVDPESVLGRVGLDAVAGRRVGELSGGMTRLFGIAQATVGEPPVLVLDEPSSGLDPTMTDHVGTVIRELADDGHTVLLATHDLETVDRVADTVLVIDDGVVQVADSPETLKRETDSETLTHAVAQYLVGEVGGLTVRTGSRERDDG
jgi:ABC-type multidrug transport system ATPase subunit